MARCSIKYFRELILAYFVTCKETTEMAHMLDLPFELLSTIITCLVISSDDIRDWASLSAVCKKINFAVQSPEILRLIDFKVGIKSAQLEHHYHINGLVSKCVQAGNVGAERLMALVFLIGGAPLWEKIKENRLTNLSIKCATTLPLSERRGIAKSLCSGSIADLPFIMFSLEDEPELCEPYGHLHHLRLVSLLVKFSYPECVMSVRCYLKDFIEFFLGYHKYTRKGKPIAEAVLEIYEEDKLPTGSVTYMSQVVLALENQLKQEAS